MDKLSDLLRHKIFSLIPKQDILQLRLVCKALATICLPYLNIEASFCLRRHSLARLQTIANHNSLRLNLHKICFYPEILDPRLTRTQWEDLAVAVCDKEPPAEDHLLQEWKGQFGMNHPVVVSNILDDRFKDLGWQQHQALLAEQATLIADLDDVLLSIQSNFAKLPNLKAFAIKTSADHMDDDNPHQSSMRPLFTLDSSQAWYCSLWTSEHSSSQIMFPRIFNALMSTNVAIASLSASPLLRLELSADFENFISELDLTHASFILRNLRVLSLESSADCETRDHSDSDGTSIGPAFNQIFRNTSSLRSLKLMLQTDNLATETMFDGCHWTHLKTLSLYRVDIEMYSFQRFLSQHRDTLKSLSLSNSLLCEFDMEHPWLQLMVFLKYDMDLEDFYVGCELREQCLEDNEYVLDCDREVNWGSGVLMDVGEIARWLVVERLPTRYHQDAAMLRWVESLDWRHLAERYETIEENEFRTSTFAELAELILDMDASDRMELDSEVVVEWNSADN